MTTGVAGSAGQRSPVFLCAVVMRFDELCRKLMTWFGGDVMRYICLRSKLMTSSCGYCHEVISIALKPRDYQ